MQHLALNEPKIKFWNNTQPELPTFTSFSRFKFLFSPAGVFQFGRWWNHLCEQHREVTPDDICIFFNRFDEAVWVRAISDRPKLAFIFLYIFPQADFDTWTIDSCCRAFDINQDPRVFVDLESNYWRYRNISSETYLHLVKGLLFMQPNLQIDPSEVASAEAVDKFLEINASPDWLHIIYSHIY